MIVAAPITSVIIGTYAELKNDRKGLSHAFFQASAFLTRTGFFLAGWIAILAPFLIELILGQRWLPMLTAFRLMLLFTMLDPIKGTLSSMLVALGMPERISRVRLTQLAVAAGWPFCLRAALADCGCGSGDGFDGSGGNVDGVAYVRPLVDISWLKLFSAPLAALAAGLLAALLLGRVWPADLSIWWQAAIKGLGFPMVYLGLLLLLEGKAILRSSLEIMGHVSLKEGLGSACRLLQNRQ